MTITRNMVRLLVKMGAVRDYLGLSSVASACSSLSDLYILLAMAESQNYPRVEAGASGFVGRSGLSCSE